MLTIALVSVIIAHPSFLQRAQADQVITVYVWRARPRLVDADARVKLGVAIQSF
jgi:hypothetical protein